MDSTTTTLIIINLLLNFLQVLDHIFARLKSSKCWGSELQFNDSKDNKDILPIKYDAELIKKLEAFAISNEKKPDIKDTALASLSPLRACDPLNKL